MGIHFHFIRESEKCWDIELARPRLMDPSSPQWSRKLWQWEKLRLLKFSRLPHISCSSPTSTNPSWIPAFLAVIPLWGAIILPLFKIYLPLVLPSNISFTPSSQWLLRNMSQIMSGPYLKSNLVKVESTLCRGQGGCVWSYPALIPDIHSTCVSLIHWGSQATTLYLDHVGLAWRRTFANASCLHPLFNFAHFFCFPIKCPLPRPRVASSIFVN